MNRADLQKMLEDVAAANLSIAEALEKLVSLPYAKGEYTLADTHRELRTGSPEVVFGQGKNAAQLVEALQLLVKAHGRALATRVQESAVPVLLKQFPTGCFDSDSSIFMISKKELLPTPCEVAVVCAGSSDLSVAEEAALTLEFNGASVTRVRDVGIAGLHRLLENLSVIRRAKLVIAVAGMEGALPSVIAGLVSAPVIAVPTSIGYGTNFHGISTLLAMLNSCSSGMGVVNIDNGFGAGMLALRIIQSHQ
jgi:hypothetical protein